MHTQGVPATHSFGLLPIGGAGCCVSNLFSNWAAAHVTGEIVRWQSRGVPEACVQSNNGSLGNERVLFWLVARVVRSATLGLIPVSTVFLYTVYENGESPRFKIK
jgi:hypothetical protein